MSVLKFFLMYEPGTSHLDSILMRAAFNLECKIISALPIIEDGEQETNGTFYHLKMTIPDVDMPFWLGFLSGIDFCRNNREITVGYVSDTNYEIEPDGPNSCTNPDDD